jgi:hypothetical protein
MENIKAERVNEISFLKNGSKYHFKIQFLPFLTYIFFHNKRK